MQICFVSNYINHHQIPFCNAMFQRTDGSFCFIQTEKMAEERVQMGWQEKERPSYVHCYYEEAEWCQKKIMDCDVVLFGGCDEESYIVKRLEAGKTVIRISERLYKEGQWKAVSPRGLRRKYHDHTRYRKAPVYLLCAGAYVASDFHIVHAYPKKMFAWGYFPETKHYDVEQLFNGKGYLQENGKIPYLLWAGRFIDWKHPELALETARCLKQKGLKFHLDMIGGGDMEEEIRRLLKTDKLEDCVSLLGYKTPSEVRGFMEKADIFLFTSDRKEGWGAVLNEAMNSGCAVAANHLPGAVPYLIQNGENGLIYRNGKTDMLFAQAEELVRDEGLRRRMGKAAYETITQIWNAENAAERLLGLIERLPDSKTEEMSSLCPCMPAPILEEYHYEKISCKRKRTD